MEPGARGPPVTADGRPICEYWYAGRWYRQHPYGTTDKDPDKALRTTTFHARGQEGHEAQISHAGGAGIEFKQMNHRQCSASSA